MIAWVIFLACLAGVWILREREHPAVIDRGEGVRDSWDDHSWGHLGGSAVLALILALIGGNPVQGALMAIGVGIAIEAAQKHPKSGEGYWEAWDLGWDVVGAALGGFLGWLLL